MEDCDFSWGFCEDHGDKQHHCTKKKIHTHPMQSDDMRPHECACGATH